MKPSDELFHLIKALNKNERRYFKVLSSLQKGDKSYLHLYNAILQQDTYDEKQLLLKFRNKKLINNFSVAKAYLYQNVLCSLEQFNAHNDYSYTIRSLLNFTHELVNKRLYTQALKQLYKAKKIAEENEYFTYQLEIADVELKIIEDTANVEWLKENLTEYYAYINHVQQQLQNYNAYKNLVSQLFIIGVGLAQIRNKKEETTATKIINNILLKEKKQALSNRALLMFYRIHANYLFLIKQNLRKSLKYGLAIKTLLEKMNYQKIGLINQYIFNIHNTIVMGLDILSYRELLALVENFKKIKFNNPQTAYNITLHYYADLLMLSSRYGRLEDSSRKLREIEAWLNAEEYKLTPMHSFVIKFNLSVFYFITKDYKNALKWVNKILNTPKQNIVEDAYSFTHIINLIIHYELGNEDLLEYAVKSTYRYLYKKQRLYNFEKAILNFIRKEFPKIKSKEEQIKAFKKLKGELTIITRDTFEKKALEYFDIINWLESKIQNCSFVDILKNKKAK